MPSASSANAAFKTPIAGIVEAAELSAAITSITFPLGGEAVGDGCTTVPIAKVPPDTFFTVNPTAGASSTVISEKLNVPEPSVVIAWPLVPSDAGNVYASLTFILLKNL